VTAQCLGTKSVSRMEGSREAWRYVRNKGRHIVYFVRGGACNTDG
jgi:hypothetical protein